MGTNRGKQGEQGQSNQQEFCENLERAMGIEPTSEAWEASILPLYDARSLRLPRLYLIQLPREKPAAEHGTQIPHASETHASPRAAPILIGQNSKVFIPALIDGSSSPNFCTSATSSISSTATPKPPVLAITGP